MDEISNKTLATLLVVAIVISLAGTFFAMRGVSTVTNFVSGYQTYPTTGVAKVNITETLEITLTNALVDFGNGYRQPTYTVDTALCNLTSSVPFNTVCWNTTSPQASDFAIENTGNINVNITINSTTSANYFANCTGSKSYVTTPRYEFAGKVLASNGCNFDSGDLVKTNTSFTDADILLCKNLSSANGVDTFNISITLGVPKGPTGQCGRSVTFTAAKNTL